MKKRFATFVAMFALLCFDGCGHQGVGSAGGGGSVGATGVSSAVFISPRTQATTEDLTVQEFADSLQGARGAVLSTTGNGGSQVNTSTATNLRGLAVTTPSPPPSPSKGDSVNNSSVSATIPVVRSFDAINAFSLGVFVSPQQMSFVPACQAIASDSSGRAECGFNYSGGYQSDSRRLPSLQCRITYYAPNTNYRVSGMAMYYSNCGTCRQAVLNGGNWPVPSSFEGPIHSSSSLRCYGDPMIDDQWQSLHSFMVETLSTSSCQMRPEYFSYRDCR